MRKIDLDLENSIFSHDLCLRGVKGPLAPTAALHVAFPISRQGRHTEVVISELNTWPVCTPVNASPASLRMQLHDSEPKWCATPFLCGSLIRYSIPVYLGASLITLSGLAGTFGESLNQPLEVEGLCPPLPVATLTDIGYPSVHRTSVFGAELPLSLLGHSRTPHSNR